VIFCYGTNKEWTNICLLLQYCACISIAKFIAFKWWLFEISGRSCGGQNYGMWTSRREDELVLISDTRILNKTNIKITCHFITMCTKTEIILWSVEWEGREDSKWILLMLKYVMNSLTIVPYAFGTNKLQQRSEQWKYLLM